MKRAGLVVVLLAGILFAPPAPHANACTCVMRDRAQLLDAAQVVFTGVPRTVREVNPSRLAVTFDVIAVYKGEASERLVVGTASDPTACGTPFRRGVTYAVYAAGSALSLTTGLCSGTTEDVVSLAGLPSRPPSRVGPSEPLFDEAESRTIAIAAAAGLLGLIVAATAASRRIIRARPRPLV